MQNIINFWQYKRCCMIATEIDRALEVCCLPLCKVILVNTMLSSTSATNRRLPIKTSTFVIGIPCQLGNSWE